MHFEVAGRSTIFHGINLADGKLPPNKPSHLQESLHESEKCSYIGSPFPLADAPTHLAKLRWLGFNAVRLPVVWEALEHEGPGIYDDAYIAYIVDLVKLCSEYGLAVMINPHQDLWSRHSGGSGAPRWTLQACGLDPDKFSSTHAAIRHCDWPPGQDHKDPKAIPPMMWTTNHNREVVLTMFALFFAGRDIAPKCILDGVNIQDYLQDHYMAAYGRLAEALGDLPWGYDSMNEPEDGLIGWNDLDSNERENTAKIGSTPTPIQGMRLGMGMKQTVDEYRLGKTGPHKTGTMTVEPTHSCWLEKEKTSARWARDPGWKLGTCVWALHDVWNTASGELKNPKYFDLFGKGKLYEKGDWVSTYWDAFHKKWTATIRQHTSTALIFLQPPVFGKPPHRDTSEPNLAHSPHFYDALTVMHKHWHESWNADVLGLLRGSHKTKLTGLRVGSGNVRGIISDQLGQLAADAEFPSVIGETGIPFNLDDNKAYRDGDYSSHVKAMDALLSGCDDHLLSYMLWNYSAVNTHEWGDAWNGEDLSIYCAETGSFKGHEVLSGFRAAAAWCRPYVRFADHSLRSMNFDVQSSKFVAEVEAEVSGNAVIYLPWLHYGRRDGGERTDDLVVDVVVGSGTWEVKDQTLVWRYEKGGRIEVRRTGGPLEPAELGTIIEVS